MNGNGILTFLVHANANVPWLTCCMSSGSKFYNGNIKKWCNYDVNWKLCAFLKANGRYPFIILFRFASNLQKKESSFEKYERFCQLRT